MSFRIGFGIDFHQLAEGRKLMIGGVEVPHSKGSVGHSDADVLLHAICDALLGAACLGDIGVHFPDTDNSYKNIDSKILLQKTLQNLRLLFNEPKTIFLYTQNPKEAIFISDRILLLNHHKHHAGLSDVISVHFKEPRHRHIISQLPAYKAIRKKLIYALTDACAPTDLLLFPSINLLS